MREEQPRTLSGPWAMGSFGHLAVAQNPTFQAGFYAINQRRRHGGKHELEYHEHSVGHRRPMLVPPAYEEE